MENEVKNNKKFKGIFVIVLIAMIFGLYYFMVLKNPKNIFLNTINSEYKKFDKAFKNIKTEKVDSITVNYDLDFDVKVNDDYLDEETTLLLDELNKLGLSEEVAIDFENKKLKIDLNTLYDNKSLIDLGLYGIDDGFYLELKDIYEKYIEIPDVDLDSLFEINNDSDKLNDYKYVVDTFKDALLKSLSKNDFKSSSEKVVINGKTINTTKTSYLVSQRSITSLIVKLASNLKNNKKFITQVSEIVLVDEDELIEYLENISSADLASLSELDDTVLLEISVYTTGLLNETVGFEISLNMFADYAFKFYDYNDSKSIKIVGNDTTILSITNKKVEDNKYQTNVKFSDYKLTIDSTINDEEINNSFKFNYLDDEYITGKLNMKYNGEKTDLIFEVSYLEDEKEVISFKANAAVQTKIDEEIKFPKINKTILADDISEDDANKIMEKILDNEVLSDFVNVVSDAIEQMNFSNDYDYDYDFDDDYDYDFDDDYDYDFDFDYDDFDFSFNE